MKAETNITKLFCTPNAIEVIEYCKKHKQEFKLRKADELTKIAGTSKHQNVVALVSEVKFSNLKTLLANKTEGNLFLILDKIQDVHNYGSILRSAEIFKCDAVIVLNKEQAPITPAVYKTSAGAINYLNIVEISNISQTIELLKKNNFWIYASGFTENSTMLSKAKFAPNENIALILGNEGKGVSKQLLSNADYVLTIDMYGQTESLNVSVACGIFLYHIQYLKHKET